MMKKNYQPTCVNCQPDPEDPLCKGCKRLEAKQLDKESAELRVFLAGFSRSLKGE